MEEQPSNSLASALNAYDNRDKKILMEGIIQPDANFPPDQASNNPGNILLVISSGEYYSLSKDDILTLPGATTGLPQKVWVSKDAKAFHSTFVTIGAEHGSDSKHNDVTSKLHTLSGRIDEFAAKIDYFAPKSSSPTGPKLPYPCGSVEAGITASEKPSLTTIKRAVLEAAASGGPSFPPDLDDSTPISKIRPTMDDSSAESLRASCYETQPFKDNGLSIITGAITASNYPNLTLGGFIKIIQCCYDHPRRS